MVFNLINRVLTNGSPTLYSGKSAETDLGLVHPNATIRNGPAKIGD